MRKIVRWIAVTVIAAVGVVGAFWLWSAVGVFGTSRFDPAKWANKATDTSTFACYRGGTARDIQRSLLKPGVSKTEVERLLGAPYYSASTLVHYGYVLGMCSGWLDFDVLHVYFDRHDSVQASEIVQHWFFAHVRTWRPNQPLQPTSGATSDTLE